MTAIHHCLSVWKTGEFRVPPEFGPGSRTQDVFSCLHMDFRSFSPEVQTKMIDNIRSMIGRRINSTGMDPAMAQPHNDQCSFDKNFIDYIPEELIEQPDDSFNHLSSCVAATEACIQFSTVLPMGVSAIASSSQPVPCSNNNSNNITNVTSVGNTGLGNGSTIVEGATSLGG
ncbi:hypothetical protein BDD12DRAFT_872547 [Trichophaea hybrida]|nr:hypothetical protein BDD12DRAFT_872547 [Trichophaea hybrida]